ncbi:MAG: polysaccharide biosynthesis C-terminal domain-containing protein [Crocinitomicaceae bacterium]|nr:polysaccharide biosynthesis C-terminal domain-containing protein [Crocinitomicaceae bacterium]|tara:strand:- start:754 stop:2256 length:1503 start_codon:yes stop_codon:yes gene_type:complete
MGIVQKDALRTAVVSYAGVAIGFANKVFLFLAILSETEIGLLNLFLSAASMVALLANFGSLHMILKFFPILKNKETNNEGFLKFTLLVSIAGACFLGLLIFIYRVDILEYYSTKSKLFADNFIWVLPIAIGILFFRLFDGYLRAYQKNIVPVLVNEVIFRLVFTALLLLHAYDVINFYWLMVLSSLAHMGPMVVMVIYLSYLGHWKVFTARITIRPRLKKIMLKYAGITYLNNLGTSIVWTLDVLMIAGMLGLAETGVYTILLYFMRVFAIPFNSIMRVSVPLVSVHWKDRDMKSMNILYDKVSSVSLVIGLFFFLGIWSNRTELFSLLGEEFQIGIYAFLFLMIGNLIDMYTGINGIILIFSKKFRYDVFFTGSLIAVVFLLNLWFIPIWGITGAAMSSAIAFLLLNMARLLFVLKAFKIHPFKKSQFVVLALFGVVLCLMEFVPMDFGNIFVNMILKSILITLLFPVVIYFTKLEPEINSYVDKVMGVIKKKLGMDPA